MTPRYPLPTLLTAGLMLSSACSVLEPGTPITDKTYPPKPYANVAPPAPMPPDEVGDALIPEFNPTPITAFPYHSPSTFNVSVHDVDAHDFFMSLVVDSHENMVVHPDVGGRISLELKDVTLPQVLSTVQKEPCPMTHEPERCAVFPL